MLPSFCKQTITVVRPGTKEVRGSTVPDYDNPISETEVSGCSVQPASASLSEDGRVLGISEGYTAYVPITADVKAGDHIVFEDETYEINGPPKHWVGVSYVEHYVLNLIRWEG